jgi:hypothetical protein
MPVADAGGKTGCANPLMNFKNTPNTMAGYLCADV